MPKTLADDVVRKFGKRIDAAVEHHRELLLAVHGKRRQASLETMLAEQFVFNVAVLWEVFLNELLLSYLVMSPGQFSKSLKNRLLQSVRDRFGSEASRMTTVAIPRQLSIVKAGSLADPKDFNITVESADHLARRANDLLAGKYARLFTLEPEDAQFFDFVIAIRNFLGHRSFAARARLRKSVAAFTGTNAGLRGSVANVGTYVKARDANGDTRSILFGKRLVNLARRLV